MKTMPPLKAIRAKCLDCSVYQYKEISNCNIADCSLYPYRMGRNPNRRGVGNPLVFAKKTAVESVNLLSASVTNVNASAAAFQLNSLTQLSNRKDN